MPQSASTHRLQVAKQPPLVRSRPLDHFKPGDVVVGAETGRLYLVAGYERTSALFTLDLEGCHVGALRDPAGRYIGVRSAELLVEQVS